jgi:2-polyprenyl-6-hydroxyphenyl methylase/3-demethylubiquinone-9 3-methyltransferase
MSESPSAITATSEVARGDRFQFGDNWSRFLQLLDEERIAMAEASLQRMLEVEHLRGTRFLDIGSGSGLFSLAARRLGAEVTSFDFDPQSVACTRELKHRYFASDPAWTVSQGSVLDRAFLQSLGHFDVVYSWGVLHHTGAMWEALDNVAPLVAPGGKLFIAIYNDQGSTSERWHAVKRFYNRAPRPARTLLVGAIGGYSQLRQALSRMVHGQNPLAFRPRGEKQDRAMSWWYDLVDWVGGYPFEVATPEAIFEFYRARGFAMVKLKTKGGGLGCNEFVFRKTTVPDDPRVAAPVAPA